MMSFIIDLFDCKFSHIYNCAKRRGGIQFIDNWDIRWAKKQILVCLQLKVVLNNCILLINCGVLIELCAQVCVATIEVKCCFGVKKNSTTTVSASYLKFAFVFFFRIAI